MRHLSGWAVLSGVFCMALGLSGCAAIEWVSPEDLSYANLAAEGRRAQEAAYLAQPFADGTVFVVAEERGEMKTYILVPCRGGTHICAETLRGRAGHLREGPDFTTVSGAYPGRVFRLEPGGDGHLLRGGTATPLAWD